MMLLFNKMPATEDCFFLEQVMPWMHWRTAWIILLTMFLTIGILPLSILARGFMLDAMMIKKWSACKLMILSSLPASLWMFVQIILILFCIWIGILEMQTFLVHWFHNLAISQIYRNCKLWIMILLSKFDWFWVY